MTREDFLARCANAYDAGLMTDERIRLLDRWIDFVLRFEGGQMAYVADFIEDERRRCHGFYSSHVLANDAEGYALVKFAAILKHPCQICATDPTAWWTRTAYCPHREKEQS